MDSNGGTADAQAKKKGEKRRLEIKEDFKNSLLAKQDELDTEAFIKYLDGTVKLFRDQIKNRKFILSDSNDDDVDGDKQSLYGKLLENDEDKDLEGLIEENPVKDKEHYKKFEQEKDEEALLFGRNKELGWTQGTGRKSKPTQRLINTCDDSDFSDEDEEDDDVELKDRDYQAMKKLSKSAATVLARNLTMYAYSKPEGKWVKHALFITKYQELYTTWKVILDWLSDFEVDALDNRQEVVTVNVTAALTAIVPQDVVTLRINRDTEDFSGWQWDLRCVRNDKNGMVCMQKDIEGRMDLSFDIGELGPDGQEFLKSLGPQKFSIMHHQEVPFYEGKHTLVIFNDDDVFTFEPYTIPDVEERIDETWKLPESQGVDNEEDESSSESESEAQSESDPEPDPGSEIGSDEDSEDETPVRKRKSAEPAKPAAPAAATAAATAAAPAAAPAAMTKEHGYPLCSSRWLLELELRNDMVTEEEARECLLCLKRMRPPGDEDDEPLCARKKTSSATRDLQEGPSKKPRNK